MQGEPSLEKQNSELKEDLARALAEQSNIRKRLEKRSEEVTQFALRRMASSILEIVDNFELACKAAKENPSISEGLNMIQIQILEILKNHKIQQIQTSSGDVFDAEKHEISEEKESNDVESGKVIEVLKNGYQMDGKTLRFARVIVSKKENQ
eukprot:TRINITY_DN22932_c0_g1_i1.p2 TRINITY_DN22932_c0_g1~~TRINITY_DN22932_c0_g1_i1.p2  ORF type:complete len:152 (+),score=11.68 TRINITY_DN22932_c0_g1_i1:262-717(+)